MLKKNESKGSIRNACRDSRSLEDASSDPGDIGNMFPNPAIGFLSMRICFIHINFYLAESNQINGIVNNYHSSTTATVIV